MADFVDKAKHKAEEAGGKIKENTGQATGDRDLEARVAAIRPPAV